MTQNNGESIIYSGDNKKKPISTNIEAMKKKDHERIKVKFNYIESPGATLKFPFKKYHGDPVIRYELKDGEIYELPIMVIKHLNQNVGRIEHFRLIDSVGKPSILASRRVRRVMCENMEFVDFEDIGPVHIEEVKVDKLPPLRK